MPPPEINVVTGALGYTGRYIAMALLGHHPAHALGQPFLQRRRHPCAQQPGRPVERGGDRGAVAPGAQLPAVDRAA